MPCANRHGWTIGAVGSLLPVVYNADTWFPAGKWLTAHHFSTGSPLGDFVWGAFGWFGLITAVLAHHQLIPAGSGRCCGAGATNAPAATPSPPANRAGSLTDSFVAGPSRVVSEGTARLLPGSPGRGEHAAAARAPRRQRSWPQLLCIVFDFALNLAGVVHCSVCLALTVYVSTENECGLMLLPFGAFGGCLLYTLYFVPRVAKEDTFGSLIRTWIRGKAAAGPPIHRRISAQEQARMSATDLHVADLPRPHALHV